MFSHEPYKMRFPTRGISQSPIRGLACAQGSFLTAILIYICHPCSSRRSSITKSLCLRCRGAQLSVKRREWPRSVEWRWYIVFSYIYRSICPMHKYLCVYTEDNGNVLDVLAYWRDNIQCLVCTNLRLRFSCQRLSLYCKTCPSHIYGWNYYIQHRNIVLA